MVQSTSNTAPSKRSSFDAELLPPYRLLLGPGPCNVDPRVLQAASAPQLGHLDPALLRILEETAQMLRAVFQTKNELTLCVSGSGFSGAEAVLSNLLEEGDTLIVGNLGFFSDKIREIAERAGARAVSIEIELGQPLHAEQLERAFQEHPHAKMFATAIAETSTGLLQPLEDLERITHAHGALFVVDAVCGLGGVALDVDGMKIDACYACSQKCLGALPGLAPVTLNARAVSAIEQRKRPVQSYYLDLLKLNNYWNGKHAYHHTSSSNLIYALYTALRLLLEEGLETRWSRHALNGEALRAGIKATGLNILTAPGYELPVVTAVSLLDGVDELALRRHLLNTYDIEVSGGIGKLQGRLLRIGLMGYNSNRKNVAILLAALEHILPLCGLTPTPGAALAAADAVYQNRD
jgi:alanine-glyoxylate transaminase/serine-glyoxylate transaminase/serine-pyruvate transaminase